MLLNTTRKRWLIIPLLVIILSCGVNDKKENKSAKNLQRSDIIKIRAMEVFGPLERPGVIFLHDKHTDIQQTRQKDCGVCHLVEKNRQSQKFKRFEDTSRELTMGIYHKGCIECHKEASVAGKESGPIEECGGCHNPDAGKASFRKPFVFNKSLHFRHLKASENKCEVCHHEYNESGKQLVYTKGKEGSCRYCHKDITEKKLISMKLASHQACIGCHLKKEKLQIAAGPVKCRGCHSLEVQNTIKKVPNIPRIERKQPDVVMIKTGNDDIKNRMALVPFDHKAHEEFNDTCRICHHESLDKCSKCHTLAGSKDGKNIRLVQAMHSKDSKKSCVGCHRIKMKEADCAGCHAAISFNAQTELSSCIKCHINPLNQEMTGFNESSETEKAAMMLQSVKSLYKTVKYEQIPEKIVIKELVNKFMPVEFPHRQIIKTLLSRVNKSKLATYFHAADNTICQGCHHNSPQADNPPSCKSCHAKPFDEQSLSRPGILGAYHIQCMGCHKEMGLTELDTCTDCHKKNKKYSEKIKE